MDWTAIASAIVQSIEATGNIGLGIASLVQQKKANQLAREDQYYFYEDAKNWSTPANQMRLREEAGLNPYGDFSTGSVSQPVPVNQAAGIPEIMNGLQGSLSRSAEHFFTAMSQQIARKSLLLESKKLDKDIEMTDQEIKQLKSVTFFQDLMNDLKEYLLPYEKSQGQYNTQILQQDALKGQKELDNYDTRFMYEIQSLLSQIQKNSEDIESSKYMRNSYYPAVLQLQKVLNDKNIDLMSANIKRVMADTENLEISKAAIKELKENIDTMKDGPYKSLLKFIYLLLTSGVHADDFK